MFMSSEEYRESLRRYRPAVYVDGRRVESVADDEALAPGVRALGLTYDYALQEAQAPLMTAVQRSSGRRVNRMLHINDSAGDSCPGSASSSPASGRTRAGSPTTTRPTTATAASARAR
jgi:aromatic ring hydroxylase